MVKHPNHLKSKYALLVALAILGSIDCDCFTNTKKYFLCKYFYPLVVQSSPKIGAYIQDTSILYDLVSDGFVLSRKIENYTSNTSIPFFQNLYKEMTGKSFQAQCFKTAFLDNDGQYSRLFTKSYYDGTKTIIENLKNKFAPFKYSINDALVPISIIWPDFIDQPRLTKFCFENEYTPNIYNFYNNSGFGCRRGPSDPFFMEWEFSCVHDVFFDSKKRTVMLEPNGNIRFAQCRAKTTVNCPEEARFYAALMEWATFQPKLGVPGGKKKMIDFFNKTVLQPSYTLTFNKNFTYLAYFWNPLMTIFKYEFEILFFQPLSTCNFTDTIFNSSQLLAIGSWNQIGSNCWLTEVNITSYFPDSYPAKDRVKTVSIDILAPKFKNFTYLKDGKKKQYLFQTYITDRTQGDPTNVTIIMELNSDVYFYFLRDSIQMYVQRSQLAASDGIFVDEYYTSNKRKRRDAADETECEKTCKLKWESGGSSSQQNNGFLFNGALRERAEALKTCIMKCPSVN